MREAHEQVQWTCESDERREPKRAAGEGTQVFDTVTVYRNLLVLISFEA